MADIIDHEAVAEDRLITQYKESTVLIDYIKLLLTEADTLEQVFNDILEQRWLDNAIGVQLDILGALVGQVRETVDAGDFSYFGFFPNVIAVSFGKIGVPAIGGRFRAIGEPTTGFRLLTDEEYRLFIKARIARNNTSATIDDIIAQIVLLFDVTEIFLTEGTAEFKVFIPRVELSANERFVLMGTDIIPKPAGVSVEWAFPDTYGTIDTSFDDITGAVSGTVT